MSEFVTKSVTQEQRAGRIETQSPVKCMASFTNIGIALAVLAALGAGVLFAQDKDKYTLKSPSGIASEPFCLSMDLLSSRCREAARSANSPLTYTSLSSLIKTIHHSLVSRKRHSKGVVKLPGGWRVWEEVALKSG